MGGPTDLKRCRSTFCPSKRTCIRNDINPTLPSPTSLDDYDSFSVLPGERACGAFMSLTTFRALKSKSDTVAAPVQMPAWFVTMEHDVSMMKTYAAMAGTQVDKLSLSATDEQWDFLFEMARRGFAG